MPRGLVAGIFNFEKNQFNWLDFGDDNRFLTGATGISFQNNKFWVLGQFTENKSSLIKMTENLQFEKNFILEKTRDAHSLIPFEEGFLVTNTKNNEINKISIIDEKIVEESFWKYNDEQLDTVHINSITKINNKIFVSIFGEKPKEGWLNAKSGKIINISDNSVLFENLNHPHSLFNFNNELYCLESNTGIIHQFKNLNEHKELLKLEGYIRGITCDDEFYYIGSSARRRKSKSMGTLNAPIASNPEHTFSWIYKINKKTLNVEKENMMFYGSEIFELTLVSNNIKLEQDKDPIIQRIWKFEEEYLN